MERQGGDNYLTVIKKEYRGNKGVHRFCRRGTACIFDVIIKDSDAARHRGVPTDKVLEKGKSRRRKSTCRSARM